MGPETLYGGGAHGYIDYPTAARALKPQTIPV
jgi:hypothetical protein